MTSIIVYDMFQFLSIGDCSKEVIDDAMNLSNTYKDNSINNDKYFYDQDEIPSLLKSSSHTTTVPHGYAPTKSPSVASLTLLSLLFRVPHVFEAFTAFITLPSSEATLKKFSSNHFPPFSPDQVR